MAIPPAMYAGAKQAPQTASKQAPRTETGKPQDKAAAKQSPSETRNAVTHAFGKVPLKGEPKTPVAATKTAPASAPGTRNLITVPSPQDANAPPSTPANDAKAVDPRVQALLDTRRADGKTVSEKLDADAPAYIIKAAQDHYNKQKKNGEAFDNVSKFYLNNAARDLAGNGVKDAKIAPGALGEVFDTAQIGKNLDQIVKSDDFIRWSTEQQANAIEDTINNNPDIAALVAPYLQEGENHVNALRRMQSDYVRSQAFADMVAGAKTPEDGRNLVGDGLQALSSLGLAEKDLLGAGNTLAENIRAKYHPDAPSPVIDPNTNKPVQTDDGNDLARLSDGTYISLDKEGKPFADKKGGIWVYNQDGTARRDAGNAYVQYDGRAKAAYASYGGTQYMVGPDGNGRVDAQGRPLGIYRGGAVALDRNGKALADQAGNKLVFDPESGKAVADPQSGNAVVIDPVTGGIVQADADGKIIAAKNGDPYAADRKSGKFVTDANGQYVLISKDNVAPGIVPGYVIDKNNTRVVVNPEDRKAMADPSTGKTVILDPETGKPQVVPLDAQGMPKKSADGRRIAYDEYGNTIVPDEGKGPGWLVKADGDYATDTAGNYIGVDPGTGLAAAAGANGFIRNGNGLIPLWDTGTNAGMKTPDGRQVVADDDANLLMADAEGKTVIEEKSGLPFLLDPATLKTVVNPDTGRAILLDTGGLPVEYNADDGYKYLINPQTNTTARTADGFPVATNENGLPYAVRPDGTAVKNADTGNIVAYGIDGAPAIEQGTGYRIEITASGKAHAIDPTTHTPLAELDPDTGGYQMYKDDGTELTNPDTGNKIQLVPESGLKVEIDAKTGKPATDAKGNPLVVGADNRPLKTADGNAVVADLETGLPVSADASGAQIVDPASKLPRVINTETGVPLSAPHTGSPVVADPVSRHPVQVDANGKIVTDPVTAMPVAINDTTGAQIKGPGGEAAVKDPRTGLPVYYDKNSKLFTVVDPDTGDAVTDPKTGAKTVIDTVGGQTFKVLPDAQGNHLIVDENGQPVKSDSGRQPYFDQATGAVAVVNDKGEVVDPRTGKAPQAADPKELVYTTPVLLMGPPAVAMMVSGKARTSRNPVPQDDDAITPEPTYREDPGSGVRPPRRYGKPSRKAPPERPWEAPGYKMTRLDREDFIEVWNNDYDHIPNENYDQYLHEVRRIKANNPALQDIPDAELAAVRGYTSSPWYAYANHALLTGDRDLLRTYRPYIKAVKSGLTYMREAGFTYKGPSVRYWDLTPEQLLALFGDEIFTNPQYLSTSKLKKGAPLFSDRNTKIKVNHLDGVAIHDISFYPDQLEVVGEPTKKYAVSNVKRAGTRGGIGTFFRIRPFNKVTLTELPPNFGKLVGGNPNVDTPASSWSRIGKALGYAGQALDIVGGGAQIVFGGMQIDEGIKNDNPYDIASGSLNVVGGGLALGGGAAAVAGGVAAAVAAPAAGVAAFFGMISLIVDILKHQDDHNKFAGSLGDMFDSLGILKDGWREKAAQVYYNAQGEPDPAPIAHGNLP